MRVARVIRRVVHLRLLHDGKPVYCRWCKHFIGPGPMGWCELYDEQQFIFGLCLEYEPGVSSEAGPVESCD